MRVSKRSVKDVINKNFTFSDLSPRFKNVDSSTGNIFCPFHENHSTPAAKMYWNEESNIWIIHCFGECHRNFTTYDYVELILCDKYQKYASPLAFLKANMNTTEMVLQLEAQEKYNESFRESMAQQKAAYIDSVSEENYKLEDYIEALYLA